MLSFQSPGPGGTTSGMETDTMTAQWSGNGHGQMVDSVTDGTTKKARQPCRSGTKYCRSFWSRSTQKHRDEDTDRCL